MAECSQFLWIGHDGPTEWDSHSSWYAIRQMTNMAIGLKLEEGTTYCQ